MILAVGGQDQVSLELSDGSFSIVVVIDAIFAIGNSQLGNAAILHGNGDVDVGELGNNAPDGRTVGGDQDAVTVTRIGYDVIQTGLHPGPEFLVIFGIAVWIVGFEEVFGLFDGEGGNHFVKVIEA